MRERVLVETDNVKRVNKLVYRLLKRPKTEVPGLAVVYGPTGFGKTRWSEMTAFRNGWGYMRINRLQREKAFVQEIYRRLHWLIYGEDHIVRRTASKIEEMCIKLLQDNPEIVLFIDEINHKIHKREWDILEVIRDLTDRSFASIVMIGEQDTVDALNDYNPHFFGRCNFFFKFEKNTLEDVKRICNEVAEVPLDQQIIKEIYKETEGDLRKLVSYIPELENAITRKYE
ncbi:MAG: TniB family NTP-binding protein [Candidatus Cloacimonetes bacterium]|nr:TniB family NTP-binding protein [Candidatus Cloacimonadota bacterium]